ncbi:DNA-binding protein [Bacillus cereus group sp. TH204-1LC]|uniref:DNA-binding protein n=1 Tax=Bacillus cereus group sp. TH204-1LC TaxID=3018054 RepID=UPI0022E2970F|nr:DNA-binding protein [Bacillus cereus group sp. TH204-1LC]MDA1616403.1 DNA-binding protein [Bacillus cereus group sp. TH204-1LC]
MQLTNEEAAKLMKQIQPHISGFSYILQKDGKDEQEVVCGGKIKLVFDMYKYNDQKEGDLSYVTLEDGLGELLILVPGVLWRNLGAKKGDVVIASGKLFALKRECKFKSKADTDIIVSHGYEPFRVLVREINILPEEGAE